MSTVTLHIGDVFDQLAKIPDGSIDLIVTSPPFLALRSYLPDDHPDKAKEIGSESGPAAFLNTMMALTAEWGRVLAPHGSLCVELGDTYSGGQRAQVANDRPQDSGYNVGERVQTDGHVSGIRNMDDKRQGGGPGWPLSKSKTMLDTLYPACLAYGANLLSGEVSPAGRWRIRNLIVWARPNPPVGALGDKFRPATSYITVACKSPRRWFDLDAVRVPHKIDPSRRSTQKRSVRSDSGDILGAASGDGFSNEGNPAGSPPLDWHADDHPEDGDWLWKMSPQGFAGSHYATFPMALPTRLIKAMCPERVCTVCGAPSERITSAPTDDANRHREFANMLRQARADAGLTQRHVDEATGVQMASHWERRTEGDKAQPAYPNPEHWRVIVDLLRIDSNTVAEWAPIITERSGWADAQYSDEYRKAIDHTRAEGFYAHQGNDGMARVGVNGNSRNAERLTVGWTDCGHNAWRTGRVLDPFAGSGTTLVAAHNESRDAIGIDLDDRNVAMVEDRLGPLVAACDLTVNTAQEAAA